MRKNPMFAAAAMLTLALGIGANTAIFTVMRTVLLKPLAYRDPDRVVRISGGVTTVRFEEMQSAVHSYGGLGDYYVTSENISLSGAGGPEALKEARVSSNFLQILGIAPALGRGFRAEEDAPGGAPVAMIGEKLWRRRFGADPRIIGRTATFGTRPYAIIGVLPARFQFPFPGLDVWLTQPALNLRPTSPALVAFGRLRPGVTVEQASAEAEVLHRQYSAAHPGMLDGRLSIVARVAPLKEELIAKVHSLLWMLFGAVSFVLLIACGNVASLLLARAASRTREFAVRAALGAGRSRIIGQLLTESILLAIGGGTLGALLAWWSLRGITRLSALGLPRTDEIHLDAMTLLFVMTLAITTGVIFGLAPAWRGSRPELADALRASGEGSNSIGARHGLRLNPRVLLVAGQVALSMILLIGAALLMESMAHLSNVEPGFRPDHLLTMQLSLPSARYNAIKNVAFFEALVHRVEMLPGVESVTACRSLPMTTPVATPVQPANRPPALLSQRPLITLEEITPGYFRTFAIPLKRGRDIDWRDTSTAGLVAIINEKAAHTFGPAYPEGPDPVGQTVLIGASPRPVEVVGIVADARVSLADDPFPSLYRPWAQTPLPWAALAVRTHGDPLGFVNAVRGQVQALDPDQPISEVQTMDDVLESDQGQRRLILRLLTLFGGVALSLTMIGLYGVIAYSVAQRTRELGIRRALGAQPSDIIQLVIGQGFGMTLGGVAIGVAGALALTRVMKTLLFEVSATDPGTFAAIALLLGLLALVACYIPARRALRIDPMAALRQD